MRISDWSSDVCSSDLIERDRDVIVEFVREFVRRATPNPPGDTTASADFVREFLNQHRLPFREIAPAPDRPNFVGTVQFAPGERHLVLNGHIDVFPVEDAAAWTPEPWAGELGEARKS